MTSRDGTTIAFERSGTGPALVLVDGAFCFRALGGDDGFAEQIERVVAAGRRGDAVEFFSGSAGVPADAIPGARYSSLEGQSWGSVDAEALAPLLRQFLA